MNQQPDFVKGKAETKEFNNGGKILKIWIPKDEVERITKDSGINIDVKTSQRTGKLYMENWTPQDMNANGTYKPADGMVIDK